MRADPALACDEIDCYTAIAWPATSVASINQLGTRRTAPRLVWRCRPPRVVPEPPRVLCWQVLHADPGTGIVRPVGGHAWSARLCHASRRRRLRRVTSHLDSGRWTRAPRCPLVKSTVDGCVKVHHAAQDSRALMGVNRTNKIKNGRSPRCATKTEPDRHLSDDPATSPRSLGLGPVTHCTT